MTELYNRSAKRPGSQPLVKRAGAAAKLGFKAHPHMLRHACWFALAAKGHDTRALTRISSTRYAIPSCRRIGSRTFGDD